MAQAPISPEVLPLPASDESPRTMAADLEDTRLLLQVSARLVDEDNIEAIYQEILAAAIALTHADAGVVQILDASSGDLSVLAAKGFDKNLVTRFQRVSASSPTSCGLALRSNQRAYVDFDTPRESNPAFELLLGAGYRSAQSTPLVSRAGSLIGMITTHWHQRHRPSDRELRFLDLLVRQAADLIGQWNYQQALRESEARLAADLADSKQLQQISRLMEDDEFHSIYDELVDAAMILLKADAGSLQRLNAETGELELLAWCGFAPESARTWERVRTDSDCCCGMALKEGRRLVIPDIEGSDSPLRPEALVEYRRSRLRAVQSTPLTSRSGKMLGMISTQWRHPHEPGEREIRLLDIMARQAADLIERKVAVEALRDSERRYRALFNSIDEGFCTIEMIFDEDGHPADYRFLQVNPSFIRLTGITDAVGRTMREISSDHENHWFETYGRIARTGHPERFVARAEQLQRWYDVYALRVDDPALNHVAILFNDVTRRIETEEKLRQGAALDAYRVSLSDALRPLTDPGEIQAVATRILGERLRASRAVYSEVRNGSDGDYYIVLQHYHAPDTGGLARAYRATDFGSSIFDEMRAGRTLVVCDVSQDSRLGPEERAAYPAQQVAAYIAVPLLADGEQVAMIAVQQKTPRNWRADEIALVEETAGRTWAAVERALSEQARHQSEQRLRIALDSARMAAWDWDLGKDSVKWNDQHFRILGLIPDGKEKSLDYFAQFILPCDRERVVAELTRSVDEARSFQCDFRIVRADNGQIRWMCGFGQTVESRNGKTIRMTGVMYDDTEVREQAEQLRQAHDALESRVKERTHELASALRQLQDEIEVRKKVERERRDLLQRIVHLQEAERARVARELHDNLGQHMVAVLMHLEGFQRRLSLAGNEAVGPDLNEFRKVVDDLIKATHRQSWELRPAELDELGLEVAIENYVHQWSEKTGIPSDFHSVTSGNRPLDPEEMIALYRITQEALTNVARHSQATRVDIELDLGKPVCASIRDNGVGFDPETVKRRLGLLGMQERLDIVGGTLTIQAAPQRGTCIRACIP